MHEIRLVAAVLCLVVFLWGWTRVWTTDHSVDGARKKLVWSGVLAIPTFLLSAGAVAFATMKTERILQEEANTQLQRVELRDRTSSMSGVAVDLFIFMSHPQTGYLNDTVKLDEFAGLRISDTLLWRGPVPNQGRAPKLKVAVDRLDAYMLGLGYEAQEGASQELLTLFAVPDSSVEAFIELVTRFYSYRARTLSAPN